MSAGAVESDHVCQRQTGAVVAGDNDNPRLQVVEQAPNNATPLILIEMFRRLIQQNDRTSGKPSSGEVEPLRLAK